jgi:hypothetical protein
MGYGSPPSTVEEVGECSNRERDHCEMVDESGPRWTDSSAPGRNLILYEGNRPENQSAVDILKP